jgi:hypothetical protein
MRCITARHAAGPERRNRSVRSTSTSEHDKRDAESQCESRLVGSVDGAIHQLAIGDELEQWFARPEMARHVQAREERPREALDTESKERVLVGEVISTVALAGQISRELDRSDPLDGRPRLTEATEDRCQRRGPSRRLYRRAIRRDERSTVA